MKRVECECGRLVRLDRDDDSDRAICPYCGAKLARLTDEPSAERAEPVTQGPPFNKALLIGGAILALLVVVGGVTAVVLLKKDRPGKDLSSHTATDADPAPKPKSDTKTDTSTPKAKDPLKGPFAIRLAAPRKKDDVREVELKGETVTRFTIVEGDKKEPEPAKTTKFLLACKIRTLDVDDAGREKAWEFTILQLAISRLDPVQVLDKTGPVVQAKLPQAAGQGVLEFSGAAAELPEPVKAALTRATGRRLGYWLTPGDDAMFGSTKPQMPGSMWAASEDALNLWYTGVSDVVWDRASGKLVQVFLPGLGDSKPGPYAFVDMHVEAKGKIKDKTPAGLVPFGAATNELEAKVSYRLHLKDYQGPYQVTSRVDVVTKDEGKNGVGSEDLLREEFTLDITYLLQQEVAAPAGKTAGLPPVKSGV
jgi:hypothetical protein